MSIGGVLLRGGQVRLLFGDSTLGGLMFLISDALCQKLYGDSSGARFLRWYALLVPMLYCDILTDAMTKGLGQQKICVRYNILTSVLDVIFLYLLLPVYGMEGYFLSFFVTHALNFLLSIRRLLRITGQRIPLYIPLSAASAMLAALYAGSFVPSAAAKSICYLLILGSLLFLAKILTREDLLWISSLIRKKDPTM